MPTMPRNSESVAALVAALSAAQGEMRAATKDAQNPHFKSRYADLASVWDACREPLSKHGLCVLQPVTCSPADGTVTVTTILAHKSGEWISEELSMRPTPVTPQGIGSCITYARRYALAAMVGICPDDDDGNAASQTTNRESTSAKTPTNPTKADPKTDGKAAGGNPGSAQAGGEPTAPAELTPKQRWNVAVAHIHKVLGKVPADKLIADITAKHMPPGVTVIPEDRRAALLADLELAVKGPKP